MKKGTRYTVKDENGFTEKCRIAMVNLAERFKDPNALGDLARVAVNKWPDVHSQTWGLRNRMLAFMQTGHPDCMTFNQWKKVGRTCKAGKAAYIYAPKMVPTGKVDDDGKKIFKHLGYKRIPVWALPDTDGEPYEDKFKGWEPAEPPPLMDIAEKLGLTVEWTITPGAYGYYNMVDKTIAMGTQSTKTFYHELAHSLDDNIQKRKNGNGRGLKGGQQPDQEIVAEFTAQVLYSMYKGPDDPDLSKNGYEYIAHYAKAMNCPPHKAVLDLMGRCAEIIEELDALL